MADDAVVARWNGGQVTYGELHEKIASDLIRLEIDYLTQRYQKEGQTLEIMVTERLLEEEAKARGLADIEALLTTEIKDKVPDPPEADLRAFYEQVKARAGNRPYEELRDRILAEIRRPMEAKLYEDLVKGVLDSKAAELELPYPDLPRIEVSADDDPFLGPKDAPVTIVQFAEFQCPYCGKAGEAIDQVLKEYDGKVRMVYRDFPLGFHDRAIPAAVAANCAGEQDRYWEMHARLMDNQRALDDATLMSHAEAIGLDIARWQTCRADPAQVAEVEKDMADGSAAGVTGTPAFFVNGVMLSGAQPFSEFKAIIDRELGDG